MSSKRRSDALPNPMMVMLIHRALIDRSGTGAMEEAVMNAAVHAWYEGHIEAEDARSPASVGVSKAMIALPEDAFPMPPFPTKHPVREIVRQTMDSFKDPRLVVAAVPYAAALAWHAGFIEGESCHGCSFRGKDPELARAARTGRRLEILFVDDDPFGLRDSAPKRPKPKAATRAAAVKRRSRPGK